MLIKFLKDDGVMFLLKKNRIFTLVNLTFKLIKDKFYKFDTKNYNIDKFNINFNDLKQITSLALTDKNYDNYNIQLTGFTVPLEKEIFQYDFKDKESLFSVYRFRWLLIGIEEYQNNEFASKAIYIINYWIDNFEIFGKKVNETYSICERLLNILYFVSIIKNNELSTKLNINKLEDIFQSQILDILNNIEYRGKHTNNHILNNARALYILGALLELKEVKDIGKEVLVNNFNYHIQEGVLLEGSFHYQVLLTRSMIEIYNTAMQVYDNEMVNFISHKVFQMIEITNGLHSKFSNQYPLVGDISPDFPIEFFEGFPFSKYGNSKWNNIFQITIPNEKVKFNSDNKFWRKLEFNKIEIWIIKKDKIMAHAHNDNGSFYIFYKGKEILFDIGRYSYNRNSKYNFMLNQKYHNGISNNIDINRNSIFFNIFNRISEVKIYNIDSIIKISIKDCFNKKIYNLNITINKNKIFIDTSEQISLFIKEFDNIIDNIIYLEGVELILGKKLNIDKILYSPNYGVLKAALKIGIR